MGEEFERAKSYLQIADAQGVTLYDHVAALILKLLKDKPDQHTALSELEKMSASLKATLHTPQQFKEIPSLPQDARSTLQLLETINFTIASLRSQAFTPEASPVASEGELQTKVQDVAELQHLLSLAGVNLGGRSGAEGVLKLQLSIQRLVRAEARKEATRPKVAGQGILTLASARFWGIVRGLRRDYFVVEAVRHKYPVLTNGGRSRVLNQAEIDAQKERKKAARRALREQKAALQAAQDARVAAAAAAGEDPAEEDQEEIVTPRPPVGVLKEKRIKPIYEKNEPSGQGANEFIYFVTNNIEARPLLPAATAAAAAALDGEDASAVAAAAAAAASDNRVSNQWSLLPDLDPLLVVSSKALRRHLTGDLSAPVLGFPQFAGTEAALLRTIIARISASTLISPAGFHSVEEREDGRGESVIEDREYESGAIEDLVTAAGWVHHRSHLLRAGRTSVWEKPEKTEEEEEQDAKDAEEMGEEDEEEEEEEEEEAQPAAADGTAAGEEEEPDEPLPLLSSVEEDMAPRVMKGPLWSFRALPSQRTLAPHAAVIARSLLWPGAVAVAKKERAVCVYVGDGQKACPNGFTPARPPPICAEFLPVFNADEEEPNPLQEQIDPLPPAQEDEERGEDDEQDDDDQAAQDQDDEDDADQGGDSEDDNE